MLRAGDGVSHAMLTEYMCTETFGSCAILHMEMALMCVRREWRERDRVSRECGCVASCIKSVTAAVLCVPLFGTVGFQ